MSKLLIIIISLWSIGIGQLISSTNPNILDSSLKNYSVSSERSGEQPISFIKKSFDIKDLLRKKRSIASAAPNATNVRQPTIIPTTAKASVRLTSTLPGSKLKGKDVKSKVSNKPKVNNSTKFNNKTNSNKTIGNRRKGNKTSTKPAKPSKFVCDFVRTDGNYETKRVFPKLKAYPRFPTNLPLIRKKHHVLMKYPMNEIFQSKGSGIYEIPTDLVYRLGAIVKVSPNVTFTIESNVHLVVNTSIYNYRSMICMLRLRASKLESLCEMPRKSGTVIHYTQYPRAIKMEEAGPKKSKITYLKDQFIDYVNSPGATINGTKHQLFVKTHLC